MFVSRQVSTLSDDPILPNTANFTQTETLAINHNKKNPLSQVLKSLLQSACPRGWTDHCPFGCSGCEPFTLFVDLSSADR